MSDFDQIIFKEKTFANIIEDIYTSKQKRSKKIEELVDHLNSLINNITEATIIVPVLKECLEIEVDNDELLVKIAAVIQRSIAKEKSLGEADGLGGISFSESEMKELESLRTKMIESSGAKQISEKCSDIITELTGNFSNPIELSETDNLLNEIKEISQSDDIFAELKRDIDNLLEKKDD